MKQPLSRTILGRSSLLTDRSHSSLFWRNLAIQDGLLLLFLSYLVLLAISAPDGEDATLSRRIAGALFFGAALTVWLVRSETLPPGPFRSLLYRVGLFVPACFSYFLIGWLNPALGRPLLDPALMELDQAIFIITPSVWLQRFNDLPTIEWFSFFYYSYFYLMAVMLFPPLLFGKGRSQAELLFGSLVIACVGHTGYTLVPGYGPYLHLEFSEPIAGGFWWNRVLETVLSGGAMMDIFPSLHTAYPIFFALYSFGNRRGPINRYLWPVLTFVAANIVVATLLLRWHWGIDVIVGLLLAVVAWQVSAVVTSREVGRERDGYQPVWERLRRTGHPDAGG